MTADLTNLLPGYRKRILAREYVVRLAVVAAWLLVALALVHGLLLVPSYLYVHQQIESREAQIAALESAAGTENEAVLASRIATLETKAAQLAALAERGTASGAVRAVLSAPRAGIRINGITYTPGAGNSNRMTVNGTASTRDALRQYLETLAALPYVEKAELPISAYAEVSNISFTITLTGSLMP